MLQTNHDYADVKFNVKNCFKNGEQEGKTGAIWELVPVGGGGK
jgi:hypothetical protein